MHRSYLLDYNDYNVSIQLATPTIESVPKPSSRGKVDPEGSQVSKVEFILSHIKIDFRR